MSRTKNAKRGIVSGVVNNLLRLFLPFVNRTIILYVLGVEYLGIGGLFTSILQVLNITELGFGSAIAYVLYKPIADKDTDKICAILQFARRVFRYVGIAVLSLGLFCLPFIRNLISGDLPHNLNIYLLYLLYLINSSISYFLFSYKRILLNATQHYDVETAIGSAILIFQNLAQLIVLLLWRDFYLYVVVILLSNVLSNIICEIVTRRNFPKYVCSGKIEKKEINQVTKTVKGVFVSRLGHVMFTSVNNIVISSLFGLVILGQYTNYYYISSCIVGFFAVLHNTLRPVLGNCFITETKEKMFDFLKNISFLYNWAAAFCACSMLCLYQDFIGIWAGEDNLISLRFAVLMSFSFFMGRICSIPSLFVEAAGLYDESKYVYLVAGLVNLILNIILVNIIGIDGILIATIIASLLVCLGGYSYVLFNKYFVDTSLYKKYIIHLFYYTGTQVVLLLIVFAISMLFSTNSIALFVIKAIFSSIIFLLGCLIYWFCNKIQVQKSLEFVRQIIKH